MIDCPDKIKKCELQLRAGKVIYSERRQPLELACEIIAQIADRAAEKWRSLRRTNDPLTV
jgi:hypothetical protein